MGTRSTIYLRSTAVGLALIATTPANAKTDTAANAVLLDSAPAQSPQVEQSTTRDGEIDDIVVTATRRETRLQSTPVAITAVDSKTLENLNVQKVEDLARYVPGLFVQQSTFGGAAAPAIRGIGSFSLVTSASFPVAFYYDGLFQDRPYGNNLRQFDVERIEVLRGPQGVLFGRNATAGAIRIMYNLPTDELAVRGRLSAGSFNTFEGQGSVRGPVAKGVKLGIAGGAARSGGYGRNLFNNSSVYGYEAENVRATATFDPTDRFQIILRGQYAREYNTFGLKQLFAGPTGTVITANNQNIALFGTPVLGVDEFANNLPSYVEVKRKSASAELKYEAGGFDIIGLFGYNKADNISDSDTDGGDNVLFRRPTSIFNHTENRYSAKSAEVRISSTGWDRFQLDAGLYYINEFVDDRDSSLRFVAANGTVLSNARSIIGNSETFASAVFAHGAYKATNALTLRAGVRYTKEIKRAEAQTLNLITNLPGARTPGRLSFDDWSPTFGLDYKFDNDVFGYVTVSNGFKSGGFSTDPISGALIPFRPESVWSYEAGLKTDLFDRKLRLNTAVFYTDYTDLQLAQNLPNGGAVVNNAASARVYGVEFETVLRPVTEFTITGSLAYLNARFRNYAYIPFRPATTTPPSVGNAEFNLAGYPLDRAPDWKGSIVAEYVIPTPLGKLALQGSYAYEGEVAFQSVPDSPIALAGPPSSPAFERSRLYTRRAISLVDARIELTLPGDQVSIAFYGSNLTNTRYFGALNRLGGGTSTVGTVNQPRAFRAEVSFKY